MKWLRNFLRISLFSIPIVVQAAAIPTNFPTDLLYLGKPIDSLCFFENETQSPTISLKKCGIHAENNRKVTGENQEALNKGFIGYDYVWPVDNTSSNQTMNSYTYYKVAGKINSSYVIFTDNNTGGSGMFTGIYVVKRTDPNMIHLKYLTGGDRCIGGINHVQVEKNKIIYNMNITAPDFYDLAKIDADKLNVYGELQSCAACCIATANLSINPDSPNKYELVSIDFGNEPVDLTNLDAKSHQYCFSSLVNDYIKRGKHTLTPTELKQFLDDFKGKCLGTSSLQSS